MLRIVGFLFLIAKSSIVALESLSTFCLDPIGPRLNSHFMNNYMNNYILIRSCLAHFLVGIRNLWNSLEFRQELREGTPGSKVHGAGGPHAQPIRAGNF